MIIIWFIISLFHAFLFNIFCSYFSWTGSGSWRSEDPTLQGRCWRWHRSCREAQRMWEASKASKETKKNIGKLLEICSHWIWHQAESMSMETGLRDFESWLCRRATWDLWGSRSWKPCRKHRQRHALSTFWSHCSRSARGPWVSIRQFA